MKCVELMSKPRKQNVEYNLGAFTDSNWGLGSENVW